MAIKDLDQAALVVKLYDDLKRALAYAKQWAATVIALQTQISALQEYNSNASAAEKSFITDVMAVSDTYTKAIPTPPDIIVEAEPLNP